MDKGNRAQKSPNCQDKIFLPYGVGEIFEHGYNRPKGLLCEVSVSHHPSIGGGDIARLPGAIRWEVIMQEKLLLLERRGIRGSRGGRGMKGIGGIEGHITHSGYSRYSGYREYSGYSGYRG